MNNRPASTIRRYLYANLKLNKQYNTMQRNQIQNTHFVIIKVTFSHAKDQGGSMGRLCGSNSGCRRKSCRTGRSKRLDLHNANQQQNGNGRKKAGHCLLYYRCDGRFTRIQVVIFVVLSLCQYYCLVLNLLDDAINILIISDWWLGFCDTSSFHWRLLRLGCLAKSISLANFFGIGVPPRFHRHGFSPEPDWKLTHPCLLFLAIGQSSQYVSQTGYRICRPSCKPRTRDHGQSLAFARLNRHHSHYIAFKVDKSGSRSSYNYSTETSETERRLNRYWNHHYKLQTS